MELPQQSTLNFDITPADNKVEDGAKKLSYRLNEQKVLFSL